MIHKHEIPILEFACYPLVENLGIPFFFEYAYSSWQRGSNENSNGLLREYFPKKTDLAAISDEALKNALYDINHRPRKCLAYRNVALILTIYLSLKFLYNLRPVA